MEQENQLTLQHILTRARRKHARALARAINNPDDIEAAMAEHQTLQESKRAYLALIHAKMASIVKQIDDE